MQNQESNGLLDILQERLSNPALFTFAWVYVIYNWQAFGWFLLEPIKFSRRITEFSSTNIEVSFWTPVGISVLVILLGHGLSNIAEFCKRAWDQLLAMALEKLKLKKFVDEKVYTDLHDRYIQIQSQLRTTQEALDKLESIKTIDSNNLLSKPDSTSNLIQETSSEPDSETNFTQETSSELKIGNIEPYYHECISGVEINNDPVEPNSIVVVPYNRNAMFDIFINRRYITEGMSIVVNYFSESKGSYDRGYFPLDENDLFPEIPIPVELEPVIVTLILNEKSVFNGEDLPIESYKFKLEPITRSPSITMK